MFDVGEHDLANEKLSPEGDAIARGQVIRGESHGCEIGRRRAHIIERLIESGVIAKPDALLRRSE